MSLNKTNAGTKAKQAYQRIWVEGVLSGDPPAAEDAIRRHIRAHTTPFPK